MLNRTWTRKLEEQVKFLLKNKALRYLPQSSRFARVRLQIEGEGMPWNVSPEADFAAKYGDAFIFVELDTREGVSHNVAKYFYYLDRLKHKPKKIFLFHVLGPGFLESGSNYLFHMKLAEFLANKIKQDLRDSLGFMYVQSEPFEKIDEASTWLRHELDKHCP